MTISRMTHLKTAVAVAATLVATQGLADDAKDTPQPDGDAVDKAAAVQPASSMSGNLYFTDENGNPRNPSAEELIAASADFERDMDRIAGKKRGKPVEQTHANGSTSAVVALSKLSYLVAETDEDGKLVIKHGSADETGEVVTGSAQELPEM